jgi:hypothetical protein
MRPELRDGGKGSFTMADINLLQDERKGAAFDDNLVS